MIKKSTIVILFFLICVIVVSCNKSDNTKINWEKIELEKLDIDAEMLAKMDNNILTENPNINSIIILRNGNLVFENYYNDYDEDSLFDMCSATKTITSALIGIAIKEGYLEGVDEKVVTFFPEYTKEIQDPKFNELTIKDLLTMTDGLDWNDWSDLNKDIVLSNPIKYAFGLSCIKEAGDGFNYSTLNSQILSGIITKTTEMNELQFAEKYLFGPLEIEDIEWLADYQGNSVGGAYLELKARDMAKIGQLYLNKGIWNGEQIITEEWIDKTTKRFSEGGVPHGEEYGYHVWVTKVDGYDAYFAGGFGGQFIYNVPEIELVVIITSETDQHREYHRDIIDEFIVPAILSVK